MPLSNMKSHALGRRELAVALRAGELLGPAFRKSCRDVLTIELARIVRARRVVFATTRSLSLSAQLRAKNLGLLCRRHKLKKCLFAGLQLGMHGRRSRTHLLLALHMYGWGFGSTGHRSF